MITLLTGLPGNGKTLFALWYIKQKAEREQREVYYNNIKDLNLPWTLLEKPEDWMSCPAGSIIVLDEAQFVFPKKPSGAKPPAHYEELATHRHKGVDIYVITQHPSLIDNFVRQLVGQHFHAVRKFGMNRATIYEWSACNPAPQNQTSQKSAISLKWKYPKEVFSYYKSAEVHTVKRAIPAKIFLAIGFVFLVIFAGWYTMQRYKARYEKPVDGQSQIADRAGPGAVNVIDTANVVNPDVVDPIADAKQYMFNQTPRIASLPETAPKYDALTVPSRVPVPAMCVQIGSATSGKEIRCKCYTQQATPIDIEFNMCLSIARNGRFMDFDPEPMRQQEQSAQRSAQTLQHQPDVPLRQNYGAPQVIAFNEAPDPLSGPMRPPTNPDNGPPNRPNVRTATVPVPAAP
jgi:zona occludens toxin